MNKARKFLLQTSQRLELPSDIIAGVPRMELVGSEEFSLEPHKGLLEYNENKISILTSIGAIAIDGSDMKIKTMNCSRITIIGKLYHLQLLGDTGE